MLNKFGLSRHIPEAIKREVRQSCGYGCVICGNAIYEYEHIDPEFHKAKTHSPDKIALLCPTCHSYITRKIWSKDKILSARINPICNTSGFSKFEIDIDPNKEFVVTVCGNTFIQTSNIIEIDDKTILSILPSEDIHNSTPRISASFFDSNNNELAWISDNEWFGSANAFDIQTIGNKISIREKLGKLSLEIKFLPPNNIVISKINLTYNGISLVGNNEKSFRIITSNSELEVPKGEPTPKKVPFWVSVKGVKIFIGATNVIKYENLKGQKFSLPGYYEITESKLEIKKKIGQVQPTLTNTGSKEGSGIGIHYDLPDNEKIIKPISLTKRQNDNESCLCASNKLFKNCCKQYHVKLEQILNSSYELQQYNFEIQKLYKKQIRYTFDENLQGHISFGLSKEAIEIKLRRETGLNLSQLAFAFIGAKYYHLGYFSAPTIYNDIRQKVISELSHNLFHIPIVAEMSRKGFSSQDFLSPFLSKLKEVLAQRSEKHIEELQLTRIHYEAITLLRINYEGFHLSRTRKHQIEELFQLKSPISLKLSKELINIINKLNPYEKEGNYIANLECISYLNENEENKKAHDYTPNIYDSYIEKLKNTPNKTSHEEP
ncbi:HNH endonuclease [Maribacter algarum]|uniref:HNH endonuclease n=1 Tax=Maribacter algarum (ex Zhang et al. 2020) TaxID=2578118 RepID=A0A5S3QH73_9FLAO|nr:HNH endonuclease signature motif containing protein [Maribacter algarum]TMM56885.1 HNH endonuclease [Maribacter algarum]